MPIPNITAADFTPLWPALLLTLGACFLLLAEVFSRAQTTRGYQAFIAVAASVLAGTVAFRNGLLAPHGVFLGFGVLDPFSSFLTVIVCVGVALSILLASGFLRQRNAERGEFYALMLFAAAGMSLLALSAELITLFISLEVMSIATYALTAYLRRGPRPSEAGFKYFILGAFSSALLLYGTALLYGATGTTLLYASGGSGHMAALATALPAAYADPSKRALVYCAIALIASGFAFKIAAVPFHMWTPDVYEGAPTPVTALMSVGVKAAAFAAMLRVFLVLGKSVDPKMALALFSALAFLTMIFGNLLAVPQRNVKRMLAYSSVAHAGYILVGVAALFAQPSGTNAFHWLGATALGVNMGAPEAFRAETLRSILFYLFAYTVTTVGAFGALAALERREDEDKPFAWDLDRFSGLAQRRPGWAVAMAVFMLSLAGVPPTLGFMGKFMLFRSAVDAGLVGLAVVGMLSSAVAVYYYLRVVVYMFMRPAPEGQLAPERQWGTEIALVLSTVAVVALGVMPGTLSEWLAHAGNLFLGGH